MNVNKKIRIVIGNIVYAFFAQGISLLLSVLMSLVVPKILGVEQFGYWQLFLFYSSYVGFFQLGLSDGIYLKYGGAEYDNLDFKLLGTEFLLFCFSQIIFSIIILYLSLNFSSNYSRMYIYVCVGIFLILNNISVFIGYIFQATNKVKLFSTSVIIDKVFFIICVLILLIFKINYFGIFCTLYILAKLISVIYCLILGKKIILSGFCSIKIAFREMKLNIFRGINLMFSNIASMLILGIGRFFIDKRWGIEAFGKFSFSLSLTNFFLLFIGQVSMVLFPTLRQVNNKKQKEFYFFSRTILGILLAAILLLYVPANYILGIWLPQYNESLRYLVILLPLCTFDGKMQMLCNTYLKVLGKEKILLKINLLSVCISSILSIIGVYVFNNIYIVVIFMVLSVAIRSIIAERYLSFTFGYLVIKNIVFEVILVIIFVSVTWFFKPLISFLIYLVSYIVILILERSDLKEAKKILLSTLKG